MISREDLTGALSEHIDPDLYAYVVCNCGEVFHSNTKFVQHLTDAIVRRTALPQQEGPLTFRSSTEVPDTFKRTRLEMWDVEPSDFPLSAEAALRMSHISAEVDDIVTPDEDRIGKPYPCLDCGEIWPCRTIKQLDRNQK